MIVRGETTGADVVRLLGPADIEAHGATAAVNAASPLARYYREFMKHFSASDTEYLSLLPYSSLRDDRLALLFTELDGQVVVVVAPIGGSAGSARWNRLLVFVDSATDRVAEVYWHEEFRRQ
jgi:hypothetical protein